MNHKFRLKLLPTASEALVIHELVKSVSASEALPTTSVLEVALQVKQARLNMLEAAFCCPTEETDTCDSLSDLDDFAMADAFEDVGLSCSGPDQRVCDSSMSHIKETPLSENHYRDDNGLNCTKLRSQQETFDDISKRKHLEDNGEMDMRLTKDLPLESLDCERRKTLPIDPAVVLKTYKLARSVDSMLHQSVRENSDGLSMTQVKTFSPLPSSPMLMYPLPPKKKNKGDMGK